jgi:hypothetical protein
LLKKSFKLYLFYKLKNLADILIGNTKCEIQSINSNEIKCFVPKNSAGNYPILLKNSVGNSNNNIIFKYNLQITNLSSDQGEYN